MLEAHDAHGRAVQKKATVWPSNFSSQFIQSDFMLAEWKALFGNNLAALQAELA